MEDDSALKEESRRRTDQDRRAYRAEKAATAESLKASQALVEKLRERAERAEEG